jgi:hypothetical protein
MEGEAEWARGTSYSGNATTPMGDVLLNGGVMSAAVFFSWSVWCRIFLGTYVGRTGRKPVIRTKTGQFSN